MSDACYRELRRARRNRPLSPEIIIEEPCELPSWLTLKNGILGVILLGLLLVNFYVLYTIWHMKVNVTHIKKDLDNLKKERASKTTDQSITRADFALEATGGKVVKIYNTENYIPAPYTLFGVDFCTTSIGPQTMLQANVNPGECWAFKGTSGSAIIQLIGHVIIDSISLEHIIKNLSPNGAISSAPKDFIILGLQHADDRNGQLLGQFSYKNNGSSLQTFPVIESHNSYSFIEFTVLSNHGNADYTCVYRIRVHGNFASF